MKIRHAILNIFAMPIFIIEPLTLRRHAIFLDTSAGERLFFFIILHFHYAATFADILIQLQLRSALFSAAGLRH